MDLTQSKKINICTIHYNAQNFTDAAIRSVNKFMPEACIYVFDNSDKTSFKNTYNNVTVFGNTKNQLVNFSKELSKYKLASSVQRATYMRHNLSLLKM